MIEKYSEFVITKYVSVYWESFFLYSFWIFISRMRVLKKIKKQFSNRTWISLFLLSLIRHHLHFLFLINVYNMRSTANFLEKIFFFDVINILIFKFLIDLIIGEGKIRKLTSLPVYQDEFGSCQYIWLSSLFQFSLLDGQLLQKVLSIFPILYSVMFYQMLFSLN